MILHVMSNIKFKAMVKQKQNKFLLIINFILQVVLHMMIQVYMVIDEFVVVVVVVVEEDIIILIIGI